MRDLKVDQLVGFKQLSYYLPLDIINKLKKNAILNELMVIWAGIYIKAEGHVVKNRVREEYAMTYCTEGTGWLELCGHRYEVKPGDVFICPSGVPHNYGADKKNPWTNYWIHFSGNVADLYMKQMSMGTDNPILHLGNNYTVIRAFTNILEVLKKGYTASNCLLASAYLNQILAYMNAEKEELQESNYIADNQLIEKSTAYMFDHMENPLALDELADYLGISKYYYIKLFKEKMGYTPMEYYTKLKIQKACEMLEITDLKINEISKVLGFQNPYYFSTTFKKYTGKSPSAYREIG